jgi:hypothetical protein
LSEEEFHRLRDEAEERGLSLSRYVKERLFHSDEDSTVIQSDAALKAAEKRIIQAARSSTAESLKPIRHELTTLLAMVDQFALSMLSHLPEIPEPQRRQALLSGQRRHRGLQIEVEETLRRMEQLQPVPRNEASRNGELA